MCHAALSRDDHLEDVIEDKEEKNGDRDADATKNKDGGLLSLMDDLHRG